MPKQTLALIAILLTCCSTSAAPITVDPSVLDRLMAGYHVQYRVIGQLILPGDDFSVNLARQAGNPLGTYHLGTSIEWTADGGQHNYLTTVFDLADERGIDGLVWVTDQTTGVMTAEGYGANVMFPVNATNLLEASDLVLGQADYVASGPGGPLVTGLTTAHGAWTADALLPVWPSPGVGGLGAPVPEPATLALAAFGALGLLALVRSRQP